MLPNMSLSLLGGDLLTRPKSILKLTSMHLPSATPSFGTTFLKRSSRSDEFYFEVFLCEVVLSFYYFHFYIWTHLY